MDPNNKKKGLKKAKEDKEFEEAYEALLEYHKDFKYDKDNGPYCSED